MPSQPIFTARTVGDSRPRMIAIDWGTTSLRGVLIDAQGNIAQQRALPQGILQVAPDAGGLQVAGSFLLYRLARLK